MTSHSLNDLIRDKIDGRWSDWSSRHPHLADAIDRSVVDAVSLEDAHRHNDLGLLEHFQHTAVILGSVAIARSRLETVDDVRARLQDALNHIDKDRLIAAPDCGLGFLSRELAREKLAVMCTAARSI